MRRRISTAAAAAAAAAMAATVLAPATAEAGERDVREEGRCSQYGRYDLKLSPQNGRIEVEIEVDTNRRGERYRVRLFHDGRRVRNGVFTTRGISGSFTVREVQDDRRGTDRFRLRAVRVGGGNRCGGSATF